MGLIGSVFLYILGFVAAILIPIMVKLLSDETKAWLPWITTRLVARAIRKLPESERQRYDEEWRGHLNCIPGDLGKLFFALGLGAAATSIRAVANGEPSYRKLRRLCDVVFSSSTFVMLMPLIVGITIALRLESAGPLLLRTARRAPNGNQFFAYEWRTRKLGKDTGFELTKVGRFLERSNIKHLPIMLNVFLGQITLFNPVSSAKYNSDAGNENPGLVLPPQYGGSAPPLNLKQLRTFSIFALLGSIVLAAFMLISILAS
jgi:hypothetical protein